jgi:hypothetical protein
VRGLAQARDAAQHDVVDPLGHRDPPGVGRLPDGAPQLVEEERVAAAPPPAATAAPPAFKVLSARASRGHRIVVRASVPGAGVLRVRAFAGRKRVGSAQRRMQAAGEARVVLRAAGKARKLKLRIALAPNAGPAPSDQVRNVRLPRSGAGS